ncbi:MAG: Yip1 family protein [Terriglobia bacterium]
MPEETAAAAQPMGEIDRLTGVLFDPKPAFADIAAHPTRWWVPILIIAVLSLTFTYSFTQRVGWERFMRQQVAQNERFQQLPAEQREQILQQQLRFVPIFGYVGGAVGLLVLSLIVAGIFLFVFNVLLGAQVTYKQYFTLACYSFLPYALTTVLAFVLLFLKEPRDFNLQNPTTSNIGAFLDPNTSPAWLISLATSIDLFTIWVLILLATGISAAARKMSWGKAFTWVVLCWVVWLVIKTGWALAFS